MSLNSNNILDLLDEFNKQNKVKSKGSLSLMVTLSRIWQEEKFPLDIEDIRTEGRGQVKGVGGDKLRLVLLEYGITRELSSEGGRTSRGSLKLAESYLAFLNNLYRQSLFSPKKDLPIFEQWWIDRVKEYFDKQSFELQIDSTLSVSAIVSMVLDQALARQKKMQGSMIVGTVLEHLIGAKLELALKKGNVKHKTASTSDESSGASGDFEVEDSIIHVTTAPTEKLIEKCRQNIRSGYRPIVICVEGLRRAVLSLAENSDLENRIEVFEAQEFISMNVNEWSSFSSPKIKQNALRLIEKYNEIIDKTEKDNSIKIKKKK